MGNPESGLMTWFVSSFMTWFVAGSALLLLFALFLLIYGIRREKKGLLVVSVALGLLLLGAWGLLGVFITKM